VPVLPSKLVQLDESESTPNVPPPVQFDHQNSASTVPPPVHSTVLTREIFKNSKKENNTIQNFSPEQVESLDLIVGGGVDQSIAKRLISLSWSRGRDISYIQGVLGYVAGLQDVKNPAGLVVSLIERDIDRRPRQEAQDARKLLGGRKTYHLAETGGPELEKHSGRYEDCPICNKSEGGQL
jgi:hypothetical protein